MKPALAAALAAAALSVAPARAAAADTYLVAKLGYFAPTTDIVAAGGNVYQLDPTFCWELGVGANMSILGLELSGGHLGTSTGTPALSYKVSSIPVLLTAKLRIPIPVVTPYLELGGGVYFNTLEITARPSESHTEWGYHLGGGVDIRISSLLLGVEARYLSVDAGSSIVTFRVDGVTVTGNVGFYF